MPRSGFDADVESVATLGDVGDVEAGQAQPGVAVETVAVVVGGVAGSGIGEQGLGLFTVFNGCLVTPIEPGPNPLLFFTPGRSGFPRHPTPKPEEPVSPSATEVKSLGRMSPQDVDNFSMSRADRYILGDAGDYRLL